MSEESMILGEQPAPQQGFIGRFVTSLVIGFIAVMISAVAWGTLTFYTNSVYLVAAIVIGFIVAFAVTYPFNRIPFLLALLLFVPTMALTVLTVLLGEYCYYVMLLMADGYALGEAVMVVAPEFADLVAVDSAGSIIFAVIGAFIGFVNAVRRAN